MRYEMGDMKSEVGSMMYEKSRKSQLALNSLGSWFLVLWLSYLLSVVCGMKYEV